MENLCRADLSRSGIEFVQVLIHGSECICKLVDFISLGRIQVDKTVGRGAGVNPKRGGRRIYNNIGYGERASKHGAVSGR